ncbi:GTPase-activating protein [Sorochytrium milnesiophthora]
MASIQRMSRDYDAQPTSPRSPTSDVAAEVTAKYGSTIGGDSSNDDLALRRGSVSSFRSATGEMSSGSVHPGDVDESVISSMATITAAPARRRPSALQPPPLEAAYGMPSEEERSATIRPRPRPRMDFDALQQVDFSQDPTNRFHPGDEAASSALPSSVSTSSSSMSLSAAPTTPFARTLSTDSRMIDLAGDNKNATPTTGQSQSNPTGPSIPATTATASAVASPQTSAMQAAVNTALPMSPETAHIPTAAAAHSNGDSVLPRLPPQQQPIGHSTTPTNDMDAGAVTMSITSLDTVSNTSHEVSSNGSGGSSNSSSDGGGSLSTPSSGSVHTADGDSGVITFRPTDIDSDRDSLNAPRPAVANGSAGSHSGGRYATFIKSSLEKLTGWKTAAAADDDAGQQTNRPPPRQRYPFAATGTPNHAQNDDDDDEELDEVDWAFVRDHAEFWGNVIQDYDTVSRKQYKALSQAIQAGIPPKLRGTLWQLLCRSASVDLGPTTYLHLVRSSCPFEKLIQRDLARTFPEHPYFRDRHGPGQESLFNVLKAYACYDAEVGYCQGLSFVVGPLLLNMPEEEAFAVLVKLMRSYGLRGHYTPHMEGLHLRLFQFDKLLQEMLPAVYQHLAQEGIRPTMYASQWFMTLFAYRFPMELVLRVFDIIFAEGVDALLRFALALMKKNQQTILSLEFEPLAEYLKLGLFEGYLAADASDSAEVAAKSSAFVTDGLAIKLTKRQLDRLSAKYDQELKLSDPHVMLVEQLKNDNKSMDDKIKTLERNLTIVNQEHVELANELIQTKLDYSQLREVNGLMARQVHELRVLITSDASPDAVLDATPPAADQSREELLAALEMERLKSVAMAKSKSQTEADMQALVEKNEMLMLQLHEMQGALIQTKLSLAETEEARATVQKKLNELKRALA